jgi:hypothetical protein
VVLIREALSLNEVLLNVSNLSILKGFPLLDSETPPTRARFIYSQKEISIEVSCLLNRTISYPLIVGSASGLSTSQINKSRVVFKSQYPLVCSAQAPHMRNARVLPARPRWISFGFLVRDEYSHRIPREGRNPYPNCLND